MKILKRGEIPKYSKIFVCGNCGSEFEAEKGEYQSCGQLAYMHDGLEYECRCPVCKKMCYIEKY